MYYSFGQQVPPVCVSIPSCHATSLIAPMDEERINFTGVAVLLNSDSDETCLQIRKEKKRGNIGSNVGVPASERRSV